MTGDIVDKEDENPIATLQMIENLVGIAPVYFSYGNHEYAWEKKWNRQLTPMIEQFGTKVLKEEYVDIVINGNNVRLRILRI